MAEPRKTITIRHPLYEDEFSEWVKWRAAFEGGRSFIDTYTEKLSVRESDDDFAKRKKISYCPAFAKAAINEIKNSIYQRMIDVTRVGGSKSFLDAAIGQLGGVDLQGSTMNTFIGTQVLHELLPMKRVGVLVDNASDLGSTLLDKRERHPYLGLYKSENILSWSWITIDNIKRLNSVLLQECIDDIDELTGLPYGQTSRYRLMRRLDNGIEVTFYNTNSDVTDKIILKKRNIPFVFFEIPESLMKDVADYQISLLNMESADVSYAIKSNFPIYYEFYEPKSEQIYAKPVAAPGETVTQKKSKDAEVATGSLQGRRFPKDLDPPGFINPSPDTLKVSMEKEQQIKDDIRRLVNLNLEQIGNQRASADSKKEDQRGLNSSLSFIGLILEKGEMEIVEHWCDFEGEEERTTIKYPENYSLQTEKDRRDEVDNLNEIMHSLPSETFKKEVGKKIAKVAIGHEVSQKTLDTINTEIDEAITMTSDPDQIIADHEAGFVSTKTASKARGYKPGESEQAQKDRAERIKLTMEAQGGLDNASAARGANDFGGITSASEKEGKAVRGDGKKVNKETQ